jgi:glycerophosphoryl diester phosphodiesterase
MPDFTAQVRNSLLSMLSALREPGSTSQTTLSSFYEPGRPLIIGHRGAMAVAPENTLGSFRRAIEDGGDGIELDTQLETTRTPIVLHDDTLNRTTDLRGRPSLFSVDALQDADASTWFVRLGHPWPHKEHVPSLDETLSAMPDHAVVNVELKGPTLARTRAEEAVLDVVDNHLHRLRIIVSSFHPAQLKTVRELMPNVPVGYLLDDNALFPLAVGAALPWVKPDAIHPRARIVDVAFMRAAKAAGVRVHVWGVSQSSDMSVDDDVTRLIELGVDGLIVDDVALAMRRAVGHS